MLHLCEDMQKTRGSSLCILLEHSALPFVWNASRWEERWIYSLKRDLHRARWEETSLVQEEDIPVFRRFTSCLAASYKNPAGCRCEWGSSLVLAPGSPQRQTIADSAELHARSRRHWASVKHYHRFCDFSVTLFWNGVWYEQAGQNFWTTAHSPAGGEDSGGETAQLQNIYRSCYNGPWPIYGDWAER